MCRYVDKSLLKEVIFCVFTFNFLYHLASFIIKFCDLKLHNVVSKLDLFFPTLTVFIVPYCIFFIFIFVAPYFIGVKDRLLLHRFTTTLIISATIAFLIFLIYPTYVNRDVFNIKNKILYFIHKHDVKANAYPSFHVLVTWCIWIHFRQLVISNKLKIAAHILTYLIVFSTVLIRQHGLIDIPAAIVIVEAVKFLTKKYSLDIKLFNFVETKYFRYLKRIFYSILIALSVFSTICFSFVIKYYWKGLFFKENIKQVYISDIPQEHKPKVSIEKNAWVALSTRR